MYFSIRHIIMPAARPVKGARFRPLPSASIGRDGHESHGFRSASFERAGAGISRRPARKDVVEQNDLIRNDGARLKPIGQDRVGTAIFEPELFLLARRGAKQRT